MADGIDRNQLQAELSKALSRDETGSKEEIDGNAKSAPGSAKKKRSRQRKEKESLSETPGQEKDRNDQIVSGSVKKSSGNASIPNDSSVSTDVSKPALAQPNANTKSKKAKKKEKSINSTNASIPDKLEQEMVGICDGENDSNESAQPIKTKVNKDNAGGRSVQMKGVNVEVTVKQRVTDKNVSSNPKGSGAQQGKTSENQENTKDSSKEKGKATNVNNNKPKQAKLGEETVSDEMMSKLNEHKMHVLKKPNQKFRNARYFCRLCDFHLDRIEDCEKHMSDNRHCRRKEISEVDAVLRLFPEPLEEQLRALTVAVDEMWETKGISQEEQTTRLNIVKRLETALQEQISDVLLNMYGSSLTGFGLKEADINVDLSSTDEKRKLTHLLTEVHTTIKDLEDTGFSQIRADFSAKVPVLRLTDTDSGLVVTMAIHCYSALCSSHLLAIYSDMDLRVRKLAVAFRYWAHLCGLDRQSEGFIPPQALNIMVLYFLQVQDPQAIPIISPPKVSGEDVGDFRRDEPSFKKMRSKAMKCAKEAQNHMSVGELWLCLLKFYCLDFDVAGTVVCIRSSQAVPRNVKPWNCKKLAVEDPYMTKKNITRMVNNSRIYEYWQDSIRKAYHYFGLPRDSDGKSLVSEEELKKNSLVTNLSGEAISKPNSSASSSQKHSDVKDTSKDGLDKSQQDKKKSVDIDSLTVEGKGDTEKEMEAVSIAPNPLMINKLGSNQSTENKGDGSREQSGNVQSKKAASDTLASLTADSSHGLVDSGFVELSRNTKSASVDLADTQIMAGSASVLVSNDLPDARLPISIPSVNTSGESDSPVDVVHFAHYLVTNVVRQAVHTVTSDTALVINSKPPKLTSQCSQDDMLEPPSPIVSEPPKDLLNESSTPNETEKSSADINDTGAGETDLSLKHAEIPSNAEEGRKSAFHSLDPCNYDFDKNYFTDGKGPMLMCTYCEKEGHLRNACPEDELPEVLDLPEMTQNHLKILSEILDLVPSDVGLSESSIRERWRFLRALEEFIQYQFDDAQLTLFGSTCNGFGFDKSDMDICMTFRRKRGKIDKVHVIETLARRLKHYNELYNIQAIVTAKVPIVKFTIRYNQLEGDISLYNTLAQRNTHLLFCYSQIDPRVRTLGYAIKTFAKVCDIGDASRGSLSSYAYILMMLYYLQQVKPPVIPVLQELYEGPEKPERFIEECDAWFMEDLNMLDKLWPDKGKNKMCVAELWLGFLRFYVEEFNHKEYVVCIRQKALLTRFEKLWNGTCIAVEDPFDLSHNLGSGLTRKMNNFIFKTFINGRMLYGSPIDQNMDMFNTYQCPTDYFFDTELLSENRPPNVRGCRRCGKMGHLVKSCPVARKEREEEEEQRHRQQRQPQHRQQQHPQQRPPKQIQNQPGKIQQQGGRNQDKGPQRYNDSQPQYWDRDPRERWHDSSTSNNGNNGRLPSGSNGGNAKANSSTSHALSYEHNQSRGQNAERPQGYSAHQHSQQHHHHQMQYQKSQTFYNNNSYQQPYHNQQHHHHHQHQQQQQQQYHRQQQHQQMRHSQQEQQRHAIMAANNNRSGQMQPPPGFMQPLMASTPRTNMNAHHHQQQYQHPPPGLCGPQQQLHHHPRPGILGPMHHQTKGQMGPPGHGPMQGYNMSGSGVRTSNTQGMNPVVQGLFSSAQGQVLNMGTHRNPSQY